MSVGTPPPDGTLSVVTSAGWALGGAIMRGAGDLRDPVSGKLLWWKVASGLLTALVLAKMATSITDAGYVNPALQGMLAAGFGFLGPYLTFGILEKFFPQVFKTGDNDDHASTDTADSAAKTNRRD